MDKLAHPDFAWIYSSAQRTGHLHASRPGCGGERLLILSGIFGHDGHPLPFPQRKENYGSAHTICVSHELWHKLRSLLHPHKTGGENF